MFKQYNCNMNMISRYDISEKLIHFVCLVYEKWTCILNHFFKFFYGEYGIPTFAPPEKNNKQR